MTTEEQLAAARHEIDVLKLRVMELLVANNREVVNRRRYRDAILNLPTRIGAPNMSPWIAAVIETELADADHDQQ